MTLRITPSFHFRALLIISRPQIHRNRSYHWHRHLATSLSTSLLYSHQKEENEMNSFEMKHNLKVDSFPTIYLEINDDVLEYNVKPSEETLMKFLETATK